MRACAVSVSVALVLLAGAAAPGATGAARQGGTPAAGPDVPGPAECRVAPRTVDEVVALVRPLLPTPDPNPPAGPPLSRVERGGAPPEGTAAGGRPRPGGRPTRPPEPTPPPVATPPGRPADRATEVAVVRTVREYVACGNADDALRTLALGSDAFVAGELSRPRDGGSFTLDQIVAELAEPARPLPPERRTPMAEVGDVRLLPDGRATATVVLPSAAGGSEPPSGEATVLSAAFVRVGDRWLFDRIDDSGRGVAAR